MLELQWRATYIHEMPEDFLGIILSICLLLLQTVYSNRQQEHFGKIAPNG